MLQRTGKSGPFKYPGGWATESSSTSKNLSTAVEGGLSERTVTLNHVAFMYSVAH